jgi:hypothetical protein
MSNRHLRVRLESVVLQITALTFLKLVIARSALAQEESEEYVGGDYDTVIDLRPDGHDSCAC